MIQGSVVSVSMVVLLLAIQPGVGWLTFHLNKQLFDQMAGQAIWKELAIVAALLAGLKLVELVLAEGSRLVQTQLSLRIHNRLEHHLYSSIQPSSITQLETPAFNHDTTTLKNSLTQIEQSISSIIGLVQQTLMLGVYGYIIFTYSWLTALILLLFSLPLFWVELLSALRLEKYFHKVAQQQIESMLASDLILRPQALKETMIFGSQRYLLRRWSEAAEAVIRKTFSLKLGEFNLRSFAVIFQPIGFLLAQFIFFNKLVDHSITLGDYAALSAAAVTVFANMTQIAGNSRIFNQIPIATRNFKTFIAKYIGTPEKEHTAQPPSVQHIRLNRLTFTYPNAAAPALSDISLDLSDRDVVAIVGENGSGKSTLAKVLLGLHTVEPDMLYIQNHDINDMERQSWFRQVSVVNQDYMKYSFSVYENIALDHPSEEIRHKVRSLIEAYPMLVPAELHRELDTVLGNSLQGGRQLSGGQWQRIAIARALYKDSPYLLLDEATSELDPITELDLINRIITDRAGKTTVLVTHNLSVASMAKQIIVMHEGRIMERGSHQELLLSRGLYYEMWNKREQYEGDRVHEQSYVSGLV
ncbi:ABC transporter ATP-binding protein [Paenibacillus sp. 1011MAR3C5]|uniref:ABC transporter ATP-binding protein n=1 Tax=Paenibacillus sp. 1011MAR3C5 TaxID=1675787 RepID=UPI001603BDC7|nr:ABC transporter ATP-binding protein [Paenibacillus sp. 1011MAR3C5]